MPRGGQRDAAVRDEPGAGVIAVLVVVVEAGQEEEEAEEAPSHRVRRLRGAAAHDQAHADLRRGTRKKTICKTNFVSLVVFSFFTTRSIYRLDIFSFPLLICLSFSDTPVGPTCYFYYAVMVDPLPIVHSLPMVVSLPMVIYPYL